MRSCGPPLLRRILPDRGDGTDVDPDAAPGAEDPVDLRAPILLPAEERRALEAGDAVPAPGAGVGDGHTARDGKTPPPDPLHHRARLPRDDHRRTPLPAVGQGLLQKGDELRKPSGDSDLAVPDPAAADDRLHVHSGRRLAGRPGPEPRLSLLED